jgi:hypothetical protein
MTRSHKDIVAGGLTVLVVLTFLATHEGWSVALVGDGHRWAATVVALLGIATCALASPSRGDAGERMLAALGTLALALAVVAVASGSLTVLSLLVLDIVLLWGATTLEHMQHHSQRHVTI